MNLITLWMMKSKRFLRPSKKKVLKAQALRDGLPYQTLISSVLHKYVEGKR